MREWKGRTGWVCGAGRRRRRRCLGKKVLSKNISLSLSLWLGVPLFTCPRSHEFAKSCLVFLTMWRTQEWKYVRTQFLHLKYHMSLNLYLWITQGEKKKDKNRATLASSLNPSPLKTIETIWEMREQHAAWSLQAIQHLRSYAIQDTERSYGEF